jgi:hypothetical protein
VSPTIVVIGLLLFSCRSHFIDTGNDADRAARCNLMPPEFYPLGAPRAAILSRLLVLRCASAIAERHSFPIRISSSRRNAIDRTNQLQQLAKWICHIFRKGKLGTKCAICTPFFVEVEINFEADWSRRR